MAKIKKKGKKRKIVDSKLKWLSKPTKIIPTSQLDGRRKEGAYTGMFDSSKTILPLKPISKTSLSEEQRRMEEIKKMKMELKQQKTARSRTRNPKPKTKSDTYNKNNSARTTNTNLNKE